MSANLTKIAAAMVLAATPLVAAPAFAQDEPEAPRTSYQVIMLKLAPNAGDRWSEMMDTYYAPAAEAAGLPKTEVHWLMDGGWDIMLLRPMPRGMLSLDTHASPERDAWMKALANIAGGEDKAKALMAENDKLVTESVRYFSHTHP